MGLQEIGTECAWDDFLRQVMERVPSEGNKAYFVLRLFEALISCDQIQYSL